MDVDARIIVTRGWKWGKRKWLVFNQRLRKFRQKIEPSPEIFGPKGDYNQ